MATDVKNGTIDVFYMIYFKITLNLTLKKGYKHQYLTDFDYFSGDFGSFHVNSTKKIQKFALCVTKISLINIL
jgi:hypothetical protein